MNKPELLTKPEAAKATRISVRTLEKHIRSGTGPAVVRIGGRVFIEGGAISQWIDRRTVPPTT